jgi:RNA polymerase sigma factor (sigma-70 family)
MFVGLPDTDRVVAQMTTVEEERFTALYRAHYDAVLRYARRRVVDDRCGDVTSEVFVIAWRKMSDIPTEPLPWLYAVARRVVANQLRTDARAARLYERAAAHTTPDDGGFADSVTSSLELGAALDKLPGADREALLLVAWEGLSGRDAAKVLGCSTPAFAMRLHRARKRLDGHLRGSPTEEGTP